MTATFLSYEVYPRSTSDTARRLHAAGKKPDAPRTARQIIEEATRAHWACPHVDDPRAPDLLWGQDPLETLAEAERRAAAARTPARRKLRKDSPILLAGVIGWPGRELTPEYLAFEQASIAWLRSRWPDSLAYVLRHTDEEHLHMHFGAVPALNGRSFDIATIDPAREYAAAAPARHSEKSKAIRVAKRKLLDDFHANVGVHFGLARKTVSRKRLPRDIAVALREGEKQMAAASAAQRRQLEAARDEMGRDGDMLLRLADMRVERDDLRRRLEETERALERLRGQAGRIAQRALKLSHREARRRSRKPIAQIRHQDNERGRSGAEWAMAARYNLER